MSTEDRPPRPRSARWMAVCMVLLVALGVAGGLRLRFDTSLEPLLPAGSQARQTVLFLRDSTFASKAVLWFRLTGDGTISDLYTAADETTRRLDPRLIARVVTPPREADAMDQAMGLLDDAGELLNADDLAELEKTTEPDALRQRMRDNYLELVKPAGSFTAPMLQRDPLGIEARLLNRLLALTNGLGYRVEPKDGRLMHPNGRQLLLILETSAPVTSMEGSEALVAYLSQLSAAAPPGVQIIPICAQIHTAQNDRLMRGDMKWAGSVNAIAFLLLFLLVSRDWRVGAVFLLPLVSIAITIGLCGLVDPTPSAIVIGLAVTMAGSAVDYGIFVYTALWMGQDPKADLRRIRRPLLISHLTSLGVFAAFVFSAIPAYRQFGWLTGVSLVLSLLAAIFVLPRVLRPRGKLIGLGRGMLLQRWGGKMVPFTVASALLLIAAVWFCRHIRFDPDLSRLDGAGPAVAKNEKDFHDTWVRGDSDLGILVVTGKTREAAEEANDEVYRTVASRMGEGQFVSLASFWPSKATRAANEARWRAFWSEQRIATLRRDSAAAGAPYDFAADTFDPFFQSLSRLPSADSSQQILSTVEDQFIGRSKGDWQVLSYFDDTDANVKTVRDLIRDRSDALIVSRRAMGQAFAESAVSDLWLLAVISVVFITVALLFLTHSGLKSLLIMLPALTGIIAMLTGLTMMSLPMTVVSAVAAILILGLASDYGVFAVYAWEGRETILGQGMASVHLSAWTTLVGTGALLFARHPALYIVGVSLTSGLLGAYLTAFLVIPGICFLRDRRAARRAF